MSGVSLPPLELSTNKSLLQEQLRQPSKARRRKPSLLSTEQLSLLLSLLAIGVYQKAEAQGTEAELIITAQNNFCEVTQLILSRGELYILTGGRGDDVLRGAAGDDILSGDSGDDWLQGGAGRDEMTGGSGTDRFEIELGDGQRAADIITDFTTNDRLVLDEFLATNDLDDITLTQIELL